MPARYQVRLFDTTGTQVAIFTDTDTLLSMVFSHKLNDTGPYMVEIDGEDDRVALFDLDGIVEIRRKIEGLDGSVIRDWYTEYAGLHRTPVTLVFNDGRLSYRSHGFSYNEFLSRREIAWFSGSDEAGKSGFGETVMKEYADENIGPGALVSAGRDVDAVMTGLTIQADGAFGSTWTGRRSYQNLLDVMREVAFATKLNFFIERTSGANFLLKTFLGTDRSIVGLDHSTGLNGAGEVPIIFDVDEGTMENVAHSINRSSEVTVAISLGRGEGSNRDILVLEDATAKADSPWNHRERTRNAVDQVGSSNLTTVAQAVLDENAKNEKFNFKIVPATNRFYGSEYGLGDTLTGRFNKLGVEANLVLTGIQGSFENGVERLEHSFAEVIK